MYARVRFILILAFGACLVASCQQNPSPTPASPTPPSESTATPLPDPDIEEYAVYNDLLEARFKGYEIDQVLIIDHTQVSNTRLIEQNLAEFQEYAPLASEMVVSFMERNQQPYLLKPILDFGVKYQLLTQEEVDELRPLDEASGWKLLYEKYPNSYGFLYLSRVGFNADFTQALVYTESFHYEYLLEGGYYLMTRQGGRWMIENEYVWQT